MIMFCSTSTLLQFLNTLQINMMNTKKSHIQHQNNKTIALIEAKYTQSLNLKTKIPNFQLTTSIHKIKFYNAYREGEEQLHREEQLQRKETLLHREESSPPLLRAAAFIVAWRHCSLQLRLRRWRRINWKVEDDSWFCKVRMELREKRESQLHIVDLISQWLDFSVLGFYIYTNRSVRFFLHHLHLNLMNLLKFQLLL